MKRIDLTCEFISDKWGNDIILRVYMVIDSLRVLEASGWWNYDEVSDYDKFVKWYERTFIQCVKILDERYSGMVKDG